MKLNKKTVIIVLINIAIILTLFFAFEYYIFKNYLKTIYFAKYRPYFTYIHKPEKEKGGLIRPYEGLNYKGKPILLLGCSYVVGDGLQDYETFSYQLSEYTKRPVYNWGVSGQGLGGILVQLLAEKNQRTIKPPEHIIYVYMYNHPVRLNVMQPMYYVRKEGLIPNQKYSIFDNLYFVQLYKDLKYQDYLRNDNKNFDRYFDSLKSMIVDMKKITSELYPNSKFTVLIYDETEKNPEDKTPLYQTMMYSPRWRELEKEGVQIISTKDLIGFKITDSVYRTSPEEDNAVNPHPKGAAWELIVPELSSKLHLK